MWTFLRRVLGLSDAPIDPVKAEQAKCAELIRAIKACPRCRMGLDGHRYRLVASSVCSKENTSALAEFFDSIKAHDWSKTITFQNWEGIENNAEAYLLQCPNEEASVVIVISPFELWSNDYLALSEMVDDPTFFSNKGAETTWHLFPESATEE